MKNPVRILYIGGNQQKFSELQQYHGIDLTQKTNALEAMSLLNSGFLPNGIICEIAIIGGSGFELFDYLQNKPKFKKIPFILIADEFKDEVYYQAFNKRIDDFYVLPDPSPENLCGRIEFLAEYKKKEKTEEPDKITVVPFRMPFSKKLFDISMASLALLCLSPLLLLVMLAIRLESKGKVYYISKRVGREPFDFYKLRSMRTGADAELKKLALEKNQYSGTSDTKEIDYSSPCPECAKKPEGETCSPILHISGFSICDYWYNAQKKEVEKSKSAFVKIVDDPRITRVGKFIRNTSIDELPQLINVIKGDMSIVGNRPLPVYEAEQLTIGLISQRFNAPAGITGLWQVELRGRGGDMSQEERMRLDNQYADHFVGNNYSFWYDMKLILRTIPALFQKDTV